MQSIKEYLTHEHRECDEIFAAMEAKASSSLEEAAPLVDSFVAEMEKHFQKEEKVMFLEFETKTGMTMGPTQMMRQEHAQMRNLMEQLKESVANENKEKFFGLAETLMILLQQHNMKEEQMLYTMAQQHLSAEAPRIITMMDALIVTEQ